MQRTLPPLKLQNSPLVLVLVQVRIAPVLQMEEYVPELQERLRRAGFPGYVSGEDLQFQLGPSPAVQRAPRWEFQNKQQTESVVLGQNFIAVQTSVYDVYEAFEELFSGPLQVLAEVVEPTLVQRIGLRYVDLVRPRPDEDVSVYLEPSLHGLAAHDVGAIDLLSRFEMLAQTKVGTMRIRCQQSTEGSPLPPDLRHATLDFSSTVAHGLDRGELVTFLDFDHFSTDPIDYDPSGIVDAVGQLHDNLDQAFRAAVTRHALEVWGMQERNT